MFEQTFQKFKKKQFTFENENNIIRLTLKIILSLSNLYKKKKIKYIFGGVF